VRGVIKFLEDHGFTYVVVDEPQGFSSSVPPVVAVTAPLVMLRFHGRNRETWEKKGISTAEKFRYLYEPSELQPWVPNLRDMAKRAGGVHAIFNNCLLGFTPSATRRIWHAAELTERKVPGPRRVAWERCGATMQAYQSPPCPYCGRYLEPTGRPGLRELPKSVAAAAAGLCATRVSAGQQPPQGYGAPNYPPQAYPSPPQYPGAPPAYPGQPGYPATVHQVTAATRCLRPGPWLCPYAAQGQPAGAAGRCRIFGGPSLCQWMPLSVLQPRPLSLRRVRCITRVRAVGTGLLRDNLVDRMPGTRAGQDMPAEPRYWGARDMPGEIVRTRRSPVTGGCCCLRNTRVAHRPAAAAATDFGQSSQACDVGSR